MSIVFELLPGQEFDNPAVRLQTGARDFHRVRLSSALMGFERELVVDDGEGLFDQVR